MGARNSERVGSLRARDSAEPSGRLHANPSANGQYTVGAFGTPIQIEERSVSLTFDTNSGLSGPEVFEGRGSLPNVIGIHDAQLDWYVRVQPSPAHCPPAGTSTHLLATSWRALASAAAGEAALPNWVYKPLDGVDLPVGCRPG